MASCAIVWIFDLIFARVKYVMMLLRRGNDMY